MLRRKLILMFVPLVILLVAIAVVAIILLQDVLYQLSNTVAHDRATHAALAHRLTWVVLGLSLAFLVLVNASVLLLLRAASMILNPVDRLVAANRELAAEHFEHRVPLDRADEFDQLADAYNHLAQRLQANERKRLETLGMAALTLNHELNNAMGMIELQLQLVARRVGQREPVERSLRCIGDGLARMSRTVESLKHIKRIVLTDYVEGTKMLDLEKSTEQDEPALANATELSTAAARRDYSI
jgi:HAMP domain-containing protein